MKLVTCLLAVHFLREKYKLAGVVLSSIIGYALVQIPWESHVVFTKLFDRRQGRIYWLHQLKYLLLATIPCVLTLAAVYFIPVGRTKGLILKGVVAAAVSTAIMLVIFRKDLIEVMKKILRRS